MYSATVQNYADGYGVSVEKIEEALQSVRHVRRGDLVTLEPYSRKVLCLRLGVATQNELRRKPKSRFRFWDTTELHEKSRNQDYGPDYNRS